MLDAKVVAFSLGLFGAATFIVCVLHGLIAPPAMHVSPALEVLLPGFRWLSIGSVALGLTESFAYCSYTGLVYGATHNTLHRRLRAAVPESA